LGSPAHVANRPSPAQQEAEIPVATHKKHNTEKKIDEEKDEEKENILLEKKR